MAAMPLDVFGEMRNRRIANCRLLCSACNTTHVEVAAQTSLETRNIEVAVRGQPKRLRHRCADRLRRAHQRAARSLGFLLADRFLNLPGGTAREPVGTPSAEKMVEHDTQRVDVAGGGDRATAHLLEVGIPRRQEAQRRGGRDLVSCRKGAQRRQKPFFGCPECGVRNGVVGGASKKRGPGGPDSASCRRSPP